jgi:S-DNA-T family DNA segregation ATPase FtsK/SpoIIIE
MNRGSRRALRRMSRGDRRREPLVLYVDDRHAGEMLAGLARLAYRHRSALAPVITGMALALVGAMLHGSHAGAWPIVAIVAVVVSAGLAWPRVAPDLRRLERIYAVSLVVAGGAWLACATALGPDATSLPALLVVGTAVGGVPWWAHRRRRAKVRVERTLDAWPEIVDVAGLPGSQIMSAVVDLWGWRARIKLRRGHTVADLIAKTPAIESGLGTRHGAVQVEADPEHADQALVRVLDTDPHAAAIDWTAPADEPASVTRPVPLGLYEDARPVTVNLAHRHGLIGGVAGAGKSGVLNVVLASLAAGPDVVLWGIDLKGGMELGPWTGCLDRLATTPAEAAILLADAVAVLDARARQLGGVGSRLWEPSPESPALVVVIDEYAELSDEAAAALTHADSIARRGRAVAVTLLVATQQPTQKAMGSGAVRSQMDVRICLRVRERRDVDLVLGQGMLAAGWTAHTLNAPGKFLISTPEHTTPRRARAYRLTDDEVRSIAAQHASHRPRLDDSSRAAVDGGREVAPVTLPRVELAPTDSAAVLWAALQMAPVTGTSVPDLMAATGMRRTWVYARLQEHAENGRAVQVSRGRWRATVRSDLDGSSS